MRLSTTADLGWRTVLCIASWSAGNRSTASDQQICRPVLLWHREDEELFWQRIDVRGLGTVALPRSLSGTHKKFSVNSAAHASHLLPQPLQRVLSSEPTKRPAQGFRIMMMSRWFKEEHVAVAMEVQLRRAAVQSSAIITNFQLLPAVQYIRIRSRETRLLHPVSFVAFLSMVVPLPFSAVKKAFYDR